MPGRNDQRERGSSRATVVRQGQGPQQQNPQQALVAVTHEIDNRLAIVRASAAAGIDADRLKLVALTVFTRTPALLSCEPVSIARAIVESAQLGLEPTGLLGGAYLVPRGGKATLMIGYRGLVMLAMRSGEVQRVEARVVREKDRFEYGYGLEPYLHHTPDMSTDPGKLTYAYAVIFYRDGSKQFDVMSTAEIEAVRKRSSAGDNGPWVTDYFEMAKKTPLRRLMKMAPLTIQVAQKLDELDPEVDDANPRSSAEQERQAQLRRELQQALERDQGVTVEGTATVAPQQPPAQAATTPAGGGDPGPQEPPSATAPAPQAGPAAAGGEPRAAGQPESVARIIDTPRAAAPEPCGMVHEQLGVGPCVLAKGHPQPEHEEAGGVRWTQPRGGK